VVGGGGLVRGVKEEGVGEVTAPRWVGEVVGCHTYFFKEASFIPI
jgi:hypothetical protein